MSLPRTIAEIINDHVTLELESLDRIITERRKEKGKAAAQDESGVPAEGARLFLPTAELLTELNKDEEAPWKENKDGKKTDLSPHRLAALLKKFDLRSEHVQVAGQRSHGYWSDDLEREIKRYAREGPGE